MWAVQEQASHWWSCAPSALAPVGLTCRGQIVDAVYKRNLARAAGAHHSSTTCEPSCTCESTCLPRGGRLPPAALLLYKASPGAPLQVRGSSPLALLHFCLFCSVGLPTVIPFLLLPSIVLDIHSPSPSPTDTLHSPYCKRTCSNSQNQTPKTKPPKHTPQTTSKNAHYPSFRCC
jgi:hypothetical protein